MRRILFFTYGVGCYLLFLATYAYLACFVGNFVVPRTINTGPAAPPIWATAIDIALLVAFGLQHSVMARPAFKARWTQLVPQPIERSTYVLASCLVLIALMWFWRPIDVVVWNVSTSVGWWLAMTLFAIGWLLVPLVSIAISHFDLFGMRQVWLHLVGREYTSLAFRTPFPYNMVRHPLYIGWALAFWAIPTMTLGHLLFAITLTAYMILAAQIEERDLIHHFGAKYQEYRHRVPMFVPRLTPVSTAMQTSAESESDAQSADSKICRGIEEDHHAHAHS